jgi:hypothetical protein
LIFGCFSIALTFQNLDIVVRRIFLGSITSTIFPENIVTLQNTVIGNHHSSVFTLLKLILQEIYSIKLPGNPKLGEGKPENQNHAIVFTRGNAVQTIDMNQVYVFANMSLFNP